MSTYGRRFEDYLKVIYSLQTSKGDVRLKEVARAMGLKPPTVLQYINKLQEMGLATYSQGRVSLTEEGLRRARELMMKFKKIKEFFVDVVHMDEKKAEEVACLIEHVVDEETVARMEEVVKRLSKC
ncbi:metal-dependent transcriptional regulator [Ignicoccus hospitalis]|uniref:Iron dependent repressor n=1 Tax=Ignicoccus hospitalis (strain KIN4/I / DSM 18386 / JCM 14125) TaxID=453591 RepID=A8AAD2_IGNH4|nr:metal-dependent transcriptional regulator [Ignicoccus hospitalis]ABU81884.1 iron dependent repressor [Ignicoccus hospitalis KIN4/I]HIH89958.1 metal-dependent transcriptional regulator [Desulfurococcaceae archaeon]